MSQIPYELGESGSVAKSGKEGLNVAGLKRALFAWDLQERIKLVLSPLVLKACGKTFDRSTSDPLDCVP